MSTQGKIQITDTKRMDLESMVGWGNMFSVGVGIGDCLSMIYPKGSRFGQNNNKSKKKPHAIHHL